MASSLAAFPPVFIGDGTKQDPYTRSRLNQPVKGFESMTLIAGTSNPELATKIAERLGHPLAQGSVKTFADGEVAVSFKAVDVSKKHCYII